MHSRVAQDVLSHFALRDAKVGSAFEKKGFWRLALAREPITHELLSLALEELVAEGCIVKSGDAYFLTQAGYEHIHGAREKSHATSESGSGAAR